MDFRLRAIYAILPLVLAVGCRNTRAQQEELEKELFYQENRIYELEAQLRDARSKLDGRVDETCPPSFGVPSLLDRSPTTPTFRDAPRGGAAPAGVMPGSSSGGTSSSDFAPRVELPASPAVAVPPARSVPVISPPDSNRPEGLPGRGLPMSPAGEGTSPAPVSTPAPMSPAAPMPMSGAASEPAASSGSRFASPTRPAESVPFRTMSSPKFRSPGGRPAAAAAPRSIDEALRSAVPGPAGSRGPLAGEAIPGAAENLGGGGTPGSSPSPPPSDLNIAAITLHRRTGGWNADAKPGDEGVTVVLEPRNAGGQLVPAAGAVSIAVIDPAIDGEGGRYARLDFTAEDAQAMQRSSNVSGSGEMQFDVPWPDAPPAHAKLRIFVRLTTADGRRLQADREVTVDLRGVTRQALADPIDPREPGMLPGTDMPTAGAPLIVPGPPIPQGETIVGPVLMGPTLVVPPGAPVGATNVGAAPPELAPEGIPATAAGAPGAWKRR